MKRPVLFQLTQRCNAAGHSVLMHGRKSKCIRGSRTETVTNREETVRRGVNTV